jgi:DNA polymerase-3 subunit epsilon
LHDGKQVVDEYSSLVNPEKKIPYRIVQMTGITNQMVIDAPRFCEIAKKVIELTEDRIIVGHNINFDYGFLRHEFKSMGYTYRRKTMDTVKLSRKLIPGRRSYGLGKLCKDLDIENQARHRATGDALATTRLFELLLSLDENLDQIKTNGVRSERNKSLVAHLPSKPGVYYFYNEKGELIYVGKSINIHDRVLSHLNNNLHKRALEMKDEIADVDFQLTGNELVALLLESSEIKRRQPFYNRQQRRTFFNYGLYSFIDDNGYQNIKVTKIINDLTPMYTYSSLDEGRNHLSNLAEKFQLCQKLCGLYDNSGPCFHYQIHQCNGACVGKEPNDEYNARVSNAIENYHFDGQSFFIIDNGIEEEEKSVVKIENGKYIGFGYINEQFCATDSNWLHECIKPYQDNREIRQIINTYLRKHNSYSIVQF